VGVTVISRVEFALQLCIFFKDMSDPPSKKSKQERDGPPPSYFSLEELSGNSVTNLQRYKKLEEGFKQRYGSYPKYLCRAPGRVNIIGEHVDYSGFAVLPMAIEQDVAIASSPRTDGTIRFASLQSETYHEYSCPSQGFAIDRESIKWYSYILCGVKGMSEELNIGSPVGMDLLVEGNIPAAAGLSSSSALVCCSAITTICNNGVEFPSKKELAQMCAKAERHIGTQGGGMDQAISFLGEAGKAFMIEFNPIRVTEVQLPDDHSFVISNTLVSSNKAAESYFNTRVAECHIAARVIAKLKGLDWHEVNRLGLVMEALDESRSEMLAVVDNCLHSGTYSLDEIASILEVDVKVVKKECLSKKSKDVREFKLYDRAKHVYAEADHVYQFKTTSESGRGEDVAVKLGDLMDASHKSCSSVYECSCKELDEIVGLAKDAGALGSRLTGAGWGGSAVSLVQNGKVDSFLESLKDFYVKYDKVELLKTSLFSTSPGSGAAYYANSS